MSNSPSGWTEWHANASLNRLCGPSGKPITMVVLGGSISCGSDTSRLEQQWNYQVFLWFNATFPHANHMYVNRCRPATQSTLIGACLDSYLPPGPIDLVLLEVSECGFPELECCTFSHVG